MAKIGIALLAGAFSIIPRAEALPVLADGGASADVAVLADAARMDIASTAENNVLKWTDFSIAKGETVAFDAHNYLNLVTGANRSDIFGALSGAGNIYIINPHGILFGAGAQINVGHLYASTRALPTDDQLSTFLSDGTSPLTSAGAVNADIINCGTLKADTVLLEGNRVSIRNYAEMQKANGALLTDGVTILAKEAGGIHVGYQLGEINTDNVDSMKYYRATYGTIPDFGYQGYLLDGTTENKAVGYALINNVYELQSLKKVDTWAGQVGYGNFMLAEDIDATVTKDWNDGHGFLPITDNQVIQKGNFDGLGYKIKNITIKSTGNAALFDTFTGGTVSNLTFDGGTIEAAGNNSAGSLAWYASKNGSGTDGIVPVIRNVHSSATVKGNNAGGILAGAADAIIEDSSFSGKVISSAAGGGLLGGINYGDGQPHPDVTIRNSYNTGTIEAWANTNDSGDELNLRLGGVMGEIYGGSLTLENVYNTGNITVSDVKAPTTAVRVGGLLGNIETNAAGLYSLTNSYNKGSITVNLPEHTGDIYAGGLIGDWVKVNRDFGKDTPLDMVYNEGNIDISSAGTIYAGGLLGKVSLTSNDGLSLTRAYNGGYYGGINGADSLAKGKVLANTTDADKTSYSGGLIGYVFNGYDDGASVTLTNVYSTGSQAGKVKGGVIGYVSGYSGGKTSINTSYFLTDSGAAAGVGGKPSDDFTINGGATPRTLTLSEDADKTAYEQQFQRTSYLTWDMSNGLDGNTTSVWRIYDGHTLPMLRAFMTTGRLTTAKTYTGAAQTFTVSDIAGQNPKLNYDTNFASTTLASLTNVSDSTQKSNADLNNYVFSYQNGVDVTGYDLNITPAPLTATFTKTYDGNATTEAANVTFSGLLGSDSAKLSGTGNYWTKDAAGNLVTTKNAGTGYLVNTGGMVLDNGNYQLAGMDNTGTIEKKALEASFADISKTYDGTTTAEAGALTLSGVVSGDTVTATAAGAAYDSRNAGSRTVNYTGLAISGTDAGNYTLADTAVGKGTINRKDVTLTADAVTITEGDEIPALTGKATGLVDGDADNATYTTEATSQSKAGSYAINGTLNDDNYNAENAEANSTALTIKAKTPVADPGDTPGSDPADTPSVDPGTTPGSDPTDTPSVDPGDKPAVEPGDTTGSDLQQAIEAAEKAAASTVQETAAAARSVSSVAGVPAEAAGEPVSMENGGTNTEGLDAMAVSEGDNGNGETNAKDTENTEGDENA